MRCVVVVALAGVGCGRIAFDPLGDGDGGTSSDGTGTGDVATACAAFGPWSAPVLLTGPSAVEEDWGATTSPNGLELVLHSNRAGAGGSDLFVATRATRTDSFGAATALTTLNSAADDDSPTFSPDGLTLYFTRAARLYRAQRASLAAPWNPPQMVQELSTIAVQGPSMSKRGDELFLTIPGTTTQLARSAFDGTTFAMPAAIPELANPMNTGYPGISPDGLLLVFEGTRATGDPLLISTRTSIGGTWSPEQILTEASDSFSSEDPEISFDGTELYFSSNRPAGGPTHDLYVMTRSCL